MQGSSKNPTKTILNTASANNTQGKHLTKKLFGLNVIVLVAVSFIGLLIIDKLNISPELTKNVGRFKKDIIAKIKIMLGPATLKKKEPASPVNVLPPISAVVNAVQPPLIEEEKTSDARIRELTLNGILLSQDENLALINDQVVIVGDDIEGAKVEEIANKQVTLSFENQTITLKRK